MAWSAVVIDDRRPCRVFDRVMRRFAKAFVYRGDVDLEQKARKLKAEAERGKPQFVEDPDAVVVVSTFPDPGLKGEPFYSAEWKTGVEGAGELARRIIANLPSGRFEDEKERLRRALEAAGVEKVIVVDLAPRRAKYLERALKELGRTLRGGP